MMTLRDRKAKYLAQETAGWIMESAIAQDSPNPEPMRLPTEVNLTCFCLSPCNTCPGIMSLFRLGGYLSTPRPSESIWKVSSKWMFVLLAQTQHDKRIACIKEMSTCPLGITVWPAGWHLASSSPLSKTLTIVEGSRHSFKQKISQDLQSIVSLAPPDSTQMKVVGYRECQ